MMAKLSNFVFSSLLCTCLFIGVSRPALAEEYQVIDVTDGGTIKGAATSGEGVQIQALAQAFRVSPQVVEELWAEHATQGLQGWDAVAVHLAQAQPPAHTGPVAFPRHAVQVRALAVTFQVPPQVVEQLWARHATRGLQGWDAVAVHLVHAQPPAHTEPVAFPRHAVQVHALAQAFQVSPQVVEQLWSRHARQGLQGYGAVAVELAQAQRPAQADVIIISSTER